MRQSQFEVLTVGAGIVTAALAERFFDVDREAARVAAGIVAGAG